METNSRIQRRKQRKKRRRWLWVLSPIAILLVVAIVYGGYLASKMADVTNEAHQQLERGEKSERRIKPVYPGKDNFSVLLIGVDERPDETRSRSDVLLLATFNKDEPSIKMVSIPRDSLVEIPGRGQDKINHAHFFGGVDLTVETVEELFDIPVDFYVKLNFQAFVDIIDALGGVTVEVPFTFSEQDSSGKQDAITLYEGVQTLNGEEALAFVRMRKKDPLGDIGRGQRQQEVVRALIKKAASITSITKYDDVLEGLGDNISMNLTFQNIIALHPYAGALKSIDSLKLEGEDAYIDGTYYYALKDESVEEVSHQLKLHLGLEQEDEMIQ